MTDASYVMEDAVAAGAAFLDRIYEGNPEGWAAKIDSDGLHMSVCGECILGQLYGDYLIGLERVGLPQHGIHDSADDSESVARGFYLPLGAEMDEEHGFDVGYRLPAWERLGDLWRAQVAAREVPEVLRP